MLSFRAIGTIGGSMRRIFAVLYTFTFCALLNNVALAQPATDPGAAEKQFAQQMAREHGSGAGNDTPPPDA